MKPGFASTRPAHPFTLLAIAVAILVACGASAGERKHCLRAEIDETFMLPNGSVHPPGELRLCLIQSMSPVSGAHQTHIDGHAVGYFRSIKTRVATPAGTAPSGPYFEFVRNRHGELELRGYAWTDGSTMLAYDLTRLTKKKYQYKVTTWEGLSARNTPEAGEQEETIIRLTAVRP